MATGPSLEDLLLPNGQPIGVRARGPRASGKLREVQGAEQEAEQLFHELTRGGTPASKAGYPGTLVVLPGGRGTIGYRPRSRSGPPTIDVKVVDTHGKRIPIEKIKFVS